jgi:hypothetical protein
MTPQKKIIDYLFQPGTPGGRLYWSITNNSFSSLNNLIVIYSMKSNILYFWWRKLLSNVKAITGRHNSQ